MLSLVLAVVQPSKILAHEPLICWCAGVCAAKYQYGSVFVNADEAGWLSLEKEAYSSSEQQLCFIG